MSGRRVRCPYCDGETNLDDDGRYHQLDSGPGPLRSAVCCAMCYGVYFVEGEGHVRRATFDEERTIRVGLAAVVRAAIKGER